MKFKPQQIIRLNYSVFIYRKERGWHNLYKIVGIDGNKVYLNGTFLSGGVDRKYFIVGSAIYDCSEIIQE